MGVTSASVCRTNNFSDPESGLSDMERSPSSALANNDSGVSSVDGLIVEALHSVRTLLSMEVAFVSEFRGGKRIFRYVDCGRQFSPIQVGGADPVEETYCQRILDGRLPELLEDVVLNQEASGLPVTAKLGIGTYLGVPIRFSDGVLYGTICCFSAAPLGSPGAQPLTTLRLFADFVGRVIEKTSGPDPHDEVKTRLHDVLSNDRFTIVYQPIIDTKANQPVGYEALVRFPCAADRTPDQWFLDAAVVGCQERLEVAVIKKALAGFPRLPDGTYISVNVSPATLLMDSLFDLLASVSLDRVVLEITEHALINDYFTLSSRLAPLRRQGLRVAVDDAGAGYASFRHILKLKPDIIKLDMSLIQRIDIDQDARALSAALIRFADETNCQIVAEGVETESEMRVLREMQVTNMQGFFLGKPKPAFSGTGR